MTTTTALLSADSTMTSPLLNDKPTYLLADWSRYATYFSPSSNHRPQRNTTRWQHAFPDTDIVFQYHKIPVISSHALVRLANTLLKDSNNADRFLAISSTVSKKKKLSYHRGTARCVVSVEILPTATQQCGNYLHKSWTNQSYEVGGLQWDNV